MSSLLPWLVAGLAAGALAGGRLQGGAARALDAAGRAALAGLLFAMGAALGVQPLGLGAAGRLAVQGLALALATAAGSVAAVGLTGCAQRLGLGGPAAAGAGARAPGAGAAGAVGPTAPPAQGEGAARRGHGSGTAGMTRLALAAVAAGLAAGRLLDAGRAAALARLADVFLPALLLLVGAELGARREAWRRLRALGLRLVLLPLPVAAGSVLAGAAAAWALGMPPRLGAAVGAACGWYSLAGAWLARHADPAAGAVGFLANFLRELMTMLLAVPLRSRLGPWAPVAAGGATAMDSTLAAIARAAGPEAALAGLASGLVLTAAAPVLLQWLAGR